MHSTTMTEEDRLYYARGEVAGTLSKLGEAAVAWHESVSAHEGMTTKGHALTVAGFRTALILAAEAHALAVLALRNAP